MVLTDVQIGDLRRIKPEEIEAGGFFYLKEPDGSFSTCWFAAEELKANAAAIIDRFKQREIYIRNSSPWQPFGI